MNKILPVALIGGGIAFFLLSKNVKASNDSTDGGGYFLSSPEEQNPVNYIFNFPEVKTADLSGLSTVLTSDSGSSGGSKKTTVSNDFVGALPNFTSLSDVSSDTKKEIASAVGQANTSMISGLEYTVVPPSVAQQQANDLASYGIITPDSKKTTIDFSGVPKTIPKGV